jgi:hypothetical protein
VEGVDVGDVLVDLEVHLGDETLSTGLVLGLGARGEGLSRVAEEVVRADLAAVEGGSSRGSSVIVRRRGVAGRCSNWEALGRRLVGNDDDGLVAAADFVELQRRRRLHAPAYGELFYRVGDSGVERWEGSWSSAKAAGVVRSRLLGCEVGDERAVRGFRRVDVVEPHQNGGIILRGVHLILWKRKRDWLSGESWV